MSAPKPDRATTCVLCGMPCIPMADYDIPVCAHCDDLHQQALARLDLLPIPAPERINVLCESTKAQARLLYRHDAKPGSPEDLAELMDAFEGRIRDSGPRRAA